MAYVWINPVTERMYEPQALDELLQAHGHKKVCANIDWAAIVKEKYRAAVAQAPHTVIDIRCPKIREVMEAQGIVNGVDVTVPEIHPILIHCGQEISQREDLQDIEKIITTPCQALADMGNALGLKDTWFVPWNQFVNVLRGETGSMSPEASPIPSGESPATNPAPGGMSPEASPIQTGTPPASSPIPPGFFSELNLQTASVTGEAEIQKYFQNYTPDEVQLVEMLFCKGGCHNGDGVAGMT